MEQEAFIFGGLFALANRLQVIGDKWDKNITIKQWLLIAMISKHTDGNPSISEIAALIGYTRQNVKKMALILEKQGFVELKKDPKDARVLRVSITEKCMEYFMNRETLEIQFINDLFLGFDETQIGGLYQGLSKLKENIEEMEKKYEER